MPENIKVMTVVKVPTDLKAAIEKNRQLSLTKLFIKADAYSDKDIKQITEWMTKTKKPAEVCMSFDGDWYSFFVRVGTNKNMGVQESISGYVTDADAREKIINALVSYGVATQSQAKTFRDKNP